MREWPPRRLSLRNDLTHRPQNRAAAIEECASSAGKEACRPVRMPSLRWARGHRDADWRGAAGWQTKGWHATDSLRWMLVERGKGGGSMSRMRLELTFPEVFPFPPFDGDVDFSSAGVCINIPGCAAVFQMVALLASNHLPLKLAANVGGSPGHVILEGLEQSGDEITFHLKLRFFPLP